MDLESKNFKIETAYNKINVYCGYGQLELRSTDASLQSAIDLENPHLLKLKNLEHLMAVLLFVPAPQNVLMLGTAAGSLIHFLRHHYPETSITAVDIDAELVEHMLKLGVLPPAQAGLEYIYDDAAHYIKQCEQRFDLVVADVFTGSQTPTWLLQKTTLEQLHRTLSPQGALSCNLLIDSEHDFKRFYRDLRLVFNQQTLCMPVQELENTVAYGLVCAPPTREMPENMEHAAALSEQLGIDFMRILAVIYNTNPVGHGII